MHASIARQRDALAALCRRHGVVRLELFGSAARGGDFTAASDVDFLVEFAPEHDGICAYLDFEEALEALLGRPIDLVDRQAVMASRNYIRRAAILEDAEPVFAA